MYSMFDTSNYKNRAIRSSLKYFVTRAFDPACALIKYTPKLWLIIQNLEMIHREYDKSSLKFFAIRKLEGVINILRPDLTKTV